MASAITARQAVLRHAILSGDTELIQQALENGASLDRTIDGNTPLVFAIRNREEDASIYLLDQGADITVKPIATLEQSQKVLASEILLGVFLILCETAAYDEMIIWSLKMINWRGFHSFQVLLWSRTLFGFCMRQEIGALVGSIRRWTIKGDNLDSLRLIPFYSFTFLLASLRDAGEVEPTSVGLNFRLIFQACQAMLWGLERIVGAFFFELIWNQLKLFFSFKVDTNAQSARLSSDPFGGTQALRAIMGDNDGSEVVALALLNHGIFTAEYVQQSISQFGNDVVDLWIWAVLLGHVQVLSKLLDLGFPPTWADSSGISSLENAVCSIRTRSGGHKRVVEIFLDAMHRDGNIIPDQINQALVASSRTIRSLDNWDRVLVDNQAVFDMLLSDATNVNATDQYKRTCLSYCVDQGAFEVVEILLQRGADVNLMDERGKTPILYLTTRNASKVCHMLINAGADIDHVDNDGWTSLCLNAYSSNTEPVELLLKAGANPHIHPPNRRNPIQSSSRYCMLDMMRALLEAGVDAESCQDLSETPLLLACQARCRRADALQILLEHGAKPNVHNKDGESPLHLVCYNHSTDASGRNYTDHLYSIQRLIEHGANVNATYKTSRNGVDVDGVSALGLLPGRSSSSIRFRACKALLDAGASPYGLSDYGVPAIISSCKRKPTIDDYSYSSEDPVRLFLEAGVDLNYCYQFGKTLLHYAAESDNFVTVKTLLENGLLGSEVDSFKRTPLHLACQNRQWMTKLDYDKWHKAGMYSMSEQYVAWHCSLESSLVIQQLTAASGDAMDTDKHSCTPAHIAAKAGNPRILAMLLIQSGATLLYDLRDSRDRLPFHYAIYSPEATRALLYFHLYGKTESGRYFDIQEPSPTPMNVKSVSNELFNSFMELNKREYQEEHPNDTIDGEGNLLPWRRGMCNARDKFGNTPLHYAALIGCVGVVQQYLNLPDVDVQACNNDEETPFAYSIENRACALAIAAKLSELDIEVPSAGEVSTVPRWESDVPLSSSRTAAEMFVRAIRRRYKYGVYQTE